MSTGLATKDGTADFWRICEVPKIHFGNGLTNPETSSRHISGTVTDIAIIL
jgi:hypothetical protein